MTTLQRAEAAEHALSQDLDRIVVKSVLFTAGERDPTLPMQRPPDHRASDFSWARIPARHAPYLAAW